MISTELVNLFQNEVNRIIAGNPTLYDGITCTVNDEVSYENIELTPKHIDAHILFGSETQENDLSNKKLMNFVVFIESEKNGYEIARSLFYDVFISLNRTFQDIGTFNSKIYLTGPVLNVPFEDVADGYTCSLSMQGAIEFSTGLLVGTKYELKLSTGNYEEVKPMTPSQYKRVVGAADLQIINSSKDWLVTKQANEYGYVVTLLMEYPDGSNQSNRKALYKALLDECYYGTPNQKFALKQSLGKYTDTTNPNNPVTAYRYTYEITNLIVSTANLVYDEGSGDIAITISFVRGD